MTLGLMIEPAAADNASQYLLHSHTWITSRKAISGQVAPCPPVFSHCDATETERGVDWQQLWKGLKFIVKMSTDERGL